MEPLKLRLKNYFFFTCFSKFEIFSKDVPFGSFESKNNNLCVVIVIFEFLKEFLSERKN